MKAFWLTYLLTLVTALLLFTLWASLMFMAGCAGKSFIQHDIWKSFILTGIYLGLLRYFVHKKSTKALIVYAILALLGTPFSGLIMQGDSQKMGGQFSFSSVGMFIGAVSFPITISVLLWTLTAKEIFKYKKDKLSYYWWAGLSGAGMALLGFGLLIIVGIISYAASCHLNPALCMMD